MHNKTCYVIAWNDKSLNVTHECWDYSIKEILQLQNSKTHTTIPRTLHTIIVPAAIIYSSSAGCVKIYDQSHARLPINFQRQIYGVRVYATIIIPPYSTYQGFNWNWNTNSTYTSIINFPLESVSSTITKVRTWKILKKKT